MVQQSGINVWGFTRNIFLGKKILEFGGSVLFSCDRTTPDKIIENAISSGLKIAYTSISVNDYPPENSFVVFPLHKNGTVKEVVDVKHLCPKVVEEYFTDQRRKGTCQNSCHRCHTVKSENKLCSL